VIHPLLREARQRGAVIAGGVADGLVASGFSDAEENVVTVLGYDACVEVLRDPETFSSAYYLETLGKTQGRSLLMLDGEEHRRHRSILREVFSRRESRRWREEVIDPIVRRDFLEPLCRRGTSANLVPGTGPLGPTCQKT
jgi:cytochrome P450